MTATDWINDRRALIDAATEGPWWTTRDMSPADVFAGYGSADDVALAFDIEEPADAALIADARTSLPAALDALEAVLELHQRVGIYDECGCTDSDRQRIDHEGIYEVGLTCNRLYDICDECCRVDGYQTEDCAGGHQHSLGGDYCATVVLIREALIARTRKDT